MNLIFKKMTIDNFMSFDKEEFDFSKQPGLSLITGTNNDIPGSKNGCGKSALINAFVFCLFGKMLNQMSIKGVSNRFIPVRNTEVTIELIANDIEYKIISGIKKRGSGYCKLFKGDEELTKHSVKETRLYIEKNVILADFDVFLRAFVLTSDQFYNFFKMNKQDKRVFIENIFDLKIFGEMFRNIHKDNLEQGKRLSTLDALASSQYRDLGELEHKYEELMKNTKGEVEELKSSIDQLKNSKIQHVEFVDANDADKLSLASEKLNSLVNKITQTKSNLEYQVKTKKSSINRLKADHAKRVAYIKKYIDTYHQLSEHSKPIISEKLGLGDQKKEVVDIINQLKADAVELRDVSNKLSKAVIPDGTKEKIEKIRKVLNKIRASEAELRHIDGSITDKLTQIDRIKNSPSTIKELMDNKRVDYTKNKKDYDVVFDKSNTLTFIEKIISEENIRRLVVTDLIKLLNNQIQTYLVSMGADYTCMFDENLNYTFITRNGEAEYSSFSGGEKMRLSIATSFAFRDFIVNRSGINSNVLILDEYIDGGIDGLAVTEIFKILREFNVLYGQNIFVVSHREAVKLNSFDRVINVEKTNGISKLVKESV